LVDLLIRNQGAFAPGARRPAARVVRGGRRFAFDSSLRGVPPSGNRGRREASRRPESRLDGHDTPRFFYRQTEMHIPVKGIVAASRKPL